MTVAVGVITLIIGFFIGGFFSKGLYRKQIKQLNDKLTSVVSKSADELTTAYEKIEKLTKDNKNLVKQLNQYTSNE